MGGAVSATLRHIAVLLVKNVLVFVARPFSLILILIAPALFVVLMLAISYAPRAPVRSVPGG